MFAKNIVFTAPYKAEILLEPVRDVGADEVKIKLSFTTISSGTERANYVGNPTVAVLVKKDVVEYPRRCGYSSSGVVVEVGANVKEIAVGDRVAVSWSVHAEYVVVNRADVHKIPSEQISFQEAALIHIATFPMGAIRKCCLEIGESAVVMGMGILGLFAVKLLRAAGAVPIIAVDPNPAKREIALKAGADYALDPYSPNFEQQAKDITGGGAKVGIEVTGVGAGLNGILDCMAPFGRVALLGCTRSSDFTVNYYKKVHGPGITLVGAHTIARPTVASYPHYWTTHDDALAIMNLIDLGRLELLSLVEETHKPEDAQIVYTRLAKEQSFPIVQFDWN